MITIKAPGKMILLGEYAVLEGAPALVCAVDCHAGVSLSPAANREFSVTSKSVNVTLSPFIISKKGKLKYHPGVSAQSRKKLKFFKDLFESIYNQAIKKGLEISPANITLDTDAFYSVNWHAKFGFGSSAALAVSLCAALLHGSSLTQSDNIFKFSLNAHRHAQGNMGSGIDVAASAYGGLLVYEMSAPDEEIPRPPRKLRVRDDIFILPVWTGKAANTREMVSGVGQLKKSQPDLYRQTMEKLIRISTDGCRSYEKESAEDFLYHIDEFRDTLANLGEQSGVPIVSAVHQKIAAICKKNEIHYKPSGAGGGDIGTAFSTDYERLVHLAKDLEFHGYRALETRLENKGYKID